MKAITPQIRRSAPAPARAAPAVNAIPTVDLQIDALVFHGFSRADTHRASAAFQRELTRLVTAHGLPRVFNHSPEATEYLDAGTIRASAAGPELTGARAARAIHGGLRA